MEFEDEINLSSNDERVENNGIHVESHDIEDNELLIVEESKEFQDDNANKCRDEGQKFFNGIPRVGLAFDTDEDAYYFYNAYAKKLGFSTRKKTMYANHGKVRRRDLCCSLEGTYSKKLTPKKRRDGRKCGCMACLIIKLDENSGKYIVTNFVEEHNHPLEKSENAHLLRSHRKIESAQANLIQNMRSSGMKTTDIFSYLSTEAGGAKNLSFTRTDCYNLISKTRTEFLSRGDAHCLLEYLTSKQEENKFFFYKLRTDEDNRICGCFIADPKSRCDYGNFGDVLCFDTTYKTNNYNMICAPIIGVNHHAQTILFGCGLLDCETTESFVWLFETFLIAMGGKQPQTIFTDQAAAIANAIKKVFPQSHHRLCLWHIFQNAAKHLSSVFNRFQTFARDFKRCIYDPEIVEEFEEHWERLLTTYGLQDNNWLQNLYSMKEKWAQVYGRINFCAGMTTTQRSESINKFLKKFFVGNHILREFVPQFEKALVDRRIKEKEADTKNRQTQPILITEWGVEREASIKYTRKIFQNFQDELKKCIVLKLIPGSDDGTTCYYTVREMGKANSRARSLIYVFSKQLVSCSCKKFEFHGIPCAHMLKLFSELEMSSLPSQYYLPRWTMSGVSNLVYDSRGEVIQFDLDPLSTRRYSELSHFAQTLAAKASTTEEKYTLVKTELLSMIMKIDSLSVNEKQGKTFFDCNSLNYDGPVKENNTCHSDMQVTLQNPISKKRAGQPTGRMKNVLERRPKKKKDNTSTQVQPVIGTSDEMSNIHNTSSTQASILLPQQEVNFGSIINDMSQPIGFGALLQSTHTNPNIFEYPRHAIMHGGSYHQYGHIGQPLMPYNHPLFYSQNIQGSSNPMDYLTGQPPITSQSSQVIASSSDEPRSLAKKLDFGDSS